MIKKCVIIPDSFKGTMSSIEICDCMKKKIKEYYPDCQVEAVPVADGGEGTADCFLYADGAEKRTLQADGPYREPMEVYYVKTGDTAIVEMAQCAGLPLVEDRKNPGATTTYGVGQIIAQAVADGCTRIVLGLGGSCTNDAGAGMAAALGTVFYNREGTAFVPTGDSLSQVVRIDRSRTDELLKNCTITAMCDIDNPMYGETGAAAIFGPQKGADAAMVELLDENLKAFAAAIESELGIKVADLPGAGAAGAMGAGVVAFLGGELKSGIQTVLDFVGFDRLLKGTDLVFTGEGKIDGQSLRGKVVIGVAQRAREQAVPVVAVVGDIGDDADGAYGMGVSAIFSINRVAVPFSEAKKRCHSDLEKTMDSILRFSKISSRF